MSRQVHRLPFYQKALSQIKRIILLTRLCKYSIFHLKALDYLSFFEVRGKNYGGI